MNNALKVSVIKALIIVEHIIIDGGSTDGTLDIIERHENNNAIKVSEPDNGTYHALNKGIKLATGDIIGILHADDFFAHEKVVDSAVTQMTKHNVDSCYGDLLYVSKQNTDRTIRHWKSCPFREELLRKGWMPPHPTFFVKKIFTINMDVLTQTSG